MPQIRTTFGFHSTAEEVVDDIDLSETRIIVNVKSILSKLDASQYDRGQTGTNTSELTLA
jgi:hypothetical protein